MNPSHAIAIQAVKSGTISPVYCDDTIEEYIVLIGAVCYIITYWHENGQYHCADYQTALMQ